MRARARAWAHAKVPKESTCACHPLKTTSTRFGAARLAAVSALAMGAANREPREPCKQCGGNGPPDKVQQEGSRRDGTGGAG